MKNIKPLGILILSAALTGTVLIITACAGTPRMAESQAMAGSSAEEALAMEDDFAFDEKITDEAPPAPEAEPVITGSPDSEPEISIEGPRRIRIDDRIKQRTPQLLARISGPDLEPLALAAYDISVVMVNHRVRVVQDMTFYNPSYEQLSGSIMIELPDGASPSYLGMFSGTGLPSGVSAGPELLISPQPLTLEDLLEKDIPLQTGWETPAGAVEWGELQAARVVEPVQGRQVYEKITRQRIDPALSEWAGTGKFQTRVFPISPESHKRIVFAYDGELRIENGGFILPLPFPDEEDAEIRINIYSHGDYFSDQEVLLQKPQGTPIALPKTNSENGTSWSVTRDEEAEGDLIFTATPRSLDYQAVAGGHKDISGTLVHLRLKPPLDAMREGVVEETGKALFVIDTSYSSRGSISEISGRLIKRILETDTTITGFAGLSFDVTTRDITGGFQENTPENQSEFLKNIGNLWLDGATGFSDLIEYLHGSPEYASADTVFLFSDGGITWGEESIDEMMRSVPGIAEMRWVCYTYGGIASNKTLFESLTRERGRIIHAGISQDINITASAHLQPRFRLEKVSSPRQDEILVAGDPRYIYPGQYLEMAVRTRSLATTIEIDLKINGKIHFISIPIVQNETTQSFAARAWASIYTDRLLSLGHDEAITTAIALSQAFNLTNKSASFIILETDEEYIQYRIVDAELDYYDLRKAMAERGALSGTTAEALPPRWIERAGLREAAESLDPEVYAFVKAVTAAHVFAWRTVSSLVLSGSFDEITDIPGGVMNLESDYGESPPPRAIFTTAGTLKKEGNGNGAYRLLTRIVEINPGDDRGSRLVGFKLMEWGAYNEAAVLFQRVRKRRPFEPQNYLLEALALSAEGKLNEAVLRLEIVLAGEYERFDEYAKAAAAVLYLDILKTLLEHPAAIPDEKHRAFAESRLLALPAGHYRSIENPAGRLMLFWNLDDTDIDLHVRESLLTEVSYSNMSSRSGGRLLWDNTQGLGPEIYEHPSLSRRGFEVYVNYYGSSSVEGEAPAASLVGEFKREAEAYTLRYHTALLEGVDSGKIPVMPLWKKQW